MAVEAIHSLLRFLVERWSQENSVPRQVKGFEIAVAVRGWNWPELEESVYNAVASAWENQRPAESDPEPSLSFRRTWQRLVPEPVPEPDVRYCFMRSIRWHYRLGPSAATARAFHAIARQIAPLAECDNVTFDEFRQAVARGPAAFAISITAADPVNAYCDLCWALDHVKIAGPSRVTLDPDASNSEHLMSHLFGVATNIPGFDELFGGGGLMLADSMAQPAPLPSIVPPTSQSSGEEATAEPPVPLPAPPPLFASLIRETEDRGIGSRVVLVIGPFGSGKTLLSLQMAVEVARKGGVAWVMSLEQTDEECQYALEAIGISTEHASMKTYTGPIDSLKAIAFPVPGQGALAFLRPEPDDKADLGTFLQKVQKQFSLMSGYPLRLLVIDPVNALGPPARQAAASLRTRTREMFEAAKHHNVNVWFASEQPPNQSPQDRFEENVADTVIHLGAEDHNGQPRRYIEVTKSRFQQECSGRHALAIEPEGGMHVYPPAATIARSVRNSPAKDAVPPSQFGVTGIDQLFGPNALSPGDIVVLAGPGKGKALVAAQFADVDLGRPDIRNIYISDHARRRTSSLDRFRKTESVIRCSIESAIASNFAEPSRVLLLIRNTLDKYREDGFTLGRVVVTNLSRWEKEVPMLSHDVSFGIALCNLLRSYGVVSMIVNGDELDHDSSPLRETLTSQANTLILFHPREFKGRTTTLLTTIKSPGMRHPRESFELLFEPEGMRVGPAPLWRISAAGDVTAANVVLYLHAETKNHQEYNNRILNALQTTLSPQTKIAPQSLRYDPQFLSMSQYSAVDELQIFQLDEYQLPNYETAAHVLHTFEVAAHPRALEGRLPGMVARVLSDSGKRFLAIPFYQNISFLAYRSDLYKAEFTDPLPKSWDELVKRCETWEARNPLVPVRGKGKSTRARKTAQPLSPPPPEVFFSCPVYTESVETYNCFFMELLYSLAPPAFDRQCDLAAWLRPSENTLKAAMQFRTLCRRSHLLGFHSERRPRAIYMRHWYNTLNQELSAMTAAERSRVEVTPLFGGRTTAGDWYLAIPGHSASPEIGLNLIENLTGSEREMQRLQLGIGLPTRESFYSADHNGIDPPVSPYFQFKRTELITLLDNAIRRSRFHCYERFAATLSAHLQSILEIPDEAPVEDGIHRALQSLVGNIDFLRESTHCNSCSSPQLVPGPLTIKKSE